MSVVNEPSLVRMTVCECGACGSRRGAAPHGRAKPKKDSTYEGNVKLTRGSCSVA